MSERFIIDVKLSFLYAGRWLIPVIKSIAHIAFLTTEKILDQREVKDRVGSAIAQTRVKLFNPRTEQWSQYFAGVKTLKPDD